MIESARSGPNPLNGRRMLWLLDGWRKSLGYYSIFGALPLVLAAQSTDAVRDEPAELESIPTSDDARRSDRTTSCTRPAILRRHGTYLLPHQRGKFDLVSTMPGADNCPGTLIPPGTYTAAAPYTDSGDTTGANSTVSMAFPCFSNPYGYWENAGPDHIYTFTLSARGPNPQVQVSTTLTGWPPQVYVLNGQCPPGQNASVHNCIASHEGAPGMPVTLALNSVPLNVPLHVFIDSRDQPNGFGSYTIRMQDVTIAQSPPPPRGRFDFDGDGRGDVSVFRPSNGVWYLNRSTSGRAGYAWGNATDRIAPADYDADGRTDVAVFRASEGRWYILRSGTSSVSIVDPVWGSGADIPAPGDFNGLGRAQPALFRPQTGIWFLIFGGFKTVLFGQAGDIPVVGDYDGDGRSDIAVFRPSSGIWYVRSWAGDDFGYQFGVSTDKVAPADYDGDGKTDFAIYRPSEGRWYIANSGGNPSHAIVQFGTTYDIPVPDDYDGDGEADIAVYRPSDGTWWINRSSAGLVVIQWGQNGDRPIPAAYGNKNGG